MNPFHIITKPIVLISGVGLGLILLLKRTTSAPVQSVNQVNTELELAKLNAETAQHISDNETKGAMAQFSGGTAMQMYKTNADVAIAGMGADVAKYGMTTDLLKSLDSNSTTKIISLAGIQSTLTSNLNEQNNFLQLGLFQTQAQKDIAFKSLDTTQTIAVHESDNNLQAVLDTNSTNRLLVPQQLETQRIINNQNASLAQFALVSDNYQALLASQGKSYDGSGGSGKGMQYAKMGIMAVGAVAAPFTGGASLVAAGSATGAMQGAGL